MITRKDIELAAERLNNRIRVTPVFSTRLTANLHFKLEYMQFTGSFKVRGALNKLLASQIPPAGVIAASGGNAGAGVAFAASQIGVSSEIFVPTTTPKTKIANIERNGGVVIQSGELYAQCAQACNERAVATNALMVHAYDDPFVMAGQGTLGLELVSQVPRVDTILVAVGGGGLISGLAAVFGGSVKIVGTETQGTSSLSAALTHGQPVDVEVFGTASDSLGAKRLGDMPWSVLRDAKVEAIAVTDEEVQEAQKILWADFKIPSEPGSATTFAALLAGRYVPFPNENVALVISGANGDPQRFL